MTTPRVSIGMPVHNGEEHIAEALDCLLGQTEGDFELLISDNASTDATADIVFRYAARDLRVHNWRQEVDIGAIANFNAVLGRARAPFFMWAACDDLWEPAFIERLAAALDSNPDAVMAAPIITFVEPDLTPVETYAVLAEQISDMATLIDQLVALQYETVATVGKANLIYSLMRREPLLVAGGFTTGWTTGTFGVDVLALYRIVCFGRIAIVHEPLFRKRRSLATDGDGRYEFWLGCLKVIEQAPLDDAAKNRLYAVVKAIGTWRYPLPGCIQNL